MNASKLEKAFASSQQDGKGRAEAATKTCPRSQSITTLTSYKPAETTSKTSSLARESSSTRWHAHSPSHTRIGHLEKENAELRQCCWNQAINLKEQEVILHAQKEVQMKRGLRERDARPRAAGTAPIKARQAGKGRRNIPRKRPKTIRRNGSLPHWLHAGLGRSAIRVHRLSVRD